MASTRMFRDRVVSLEQTQELGEKHIDLLKGLVAEALPGFDLVEHGLEHEKDLFVLTVIAPASGATKKVSFTRMVLSDASRLPAIVENRQAPVRGLFVECIRLQAARSEIAVTMKSLLTEEERAEAAEIEAEWRKKQEAVLAARRAEEERVARERREGKRQEEARRKAQREKGRREREKTAVKEAPSVERAGGGRRRRRRGGGGGGERGPQPAGQQPAQRPPGPAPAPGPATASPQAPRPQGGGGRRRRRRGRGGPRPGGSPPAQG